MAGIVYSLFEASVGEWRCFEASLDFFSKSIEFISREDIREKYLPCLLENMRDCNFNIKMRIIDIFVHILTKNPDHKSRSKIHRFLNEDLANSRTIYDRKIFLIFCAKICSKISRKYFKDVFAWNFLRICEEKKKDIAILFAKNIV